MPWDAAISGLGVKNELELDVVTTSLRGPHRLDVVGGRFHTGRPRELRIKKRCKDRRPPISLWRRRFVSVLQPAWHPSGALFYLTDEQGFYALQRFEKMVLPRRSCPSMTPILAGSRPGLELRPAGLHFFGRRESRGSLPRPPNWPDGRRHLRRGRIVQTSLLRFQNMACPIRWAASRRARTVTFT